MHNILMRPKSLIIGDVVVLAILTIIGFATHGETGVSYLPRMAASFVPLLFGWFVLAPWFGLFDRETISDPKKLWRIPLLFLFAAPLAALLRSVMLATPVIPIFVLVLGSTNALGMMIWRWIYNRIAK
ncbi:MAG: DUF3054 domain-containing protein [Anaerolineales bacterium]|nr:MAG: DUF3054 domain-containing protein [Anaerolineales bacterium]